MVRASNGIMCCALVGIGGAIGLKFADIDQKLPFLLHRSFLTHSVFASLLLWLWVSRQSLRITRLWRWFVIGFSLAACVHLCFDLFPRGWYRHALISLPIVGWTSPAFSFLWIAGSAVLSLYVALLLIRSRQELFCGIGALLGVYSFAAQAETPVAMYALIALVAVSFLAFVLPRRLSSVG